ncbi:MAG: hypothetical protein FJ288_03620 [Planctomycetes bacterium]|nr:hypothetical protein [Planctomycetota bacterium]
MTENLHSIAAAKGNQSRDRQGAAPLPVPQQHGLTSKPWHAVLLAWLAARPRGRFATVRGRWVQTFLTACLLMAGLGTWALALVQPWTGCPSDPGMVTFAGGVDTAKIRAATSDVERLCTAAPRPVRPLARNPFAPLVAAAATAAPDQSRDRKGAAPYTIAPGPAAKDHERRPAPGAEKSVPAAGEPSAQAVLELVKGLRLEVVLTTPSGQRWAVINGRNLREGDSIAGLQVVEIQETKVKLQQAGMTCLLRMD